MNTDATHPADSRDPSAHVTRDALEEFARSIYLPQVGAVYSTRFLRELLISRDRREINVHAISDVIQDLHGVGRSKGRTRGRAFKREPLRGFMHAHWFEARFIAKNIGVHWGIDRGGAPAFDQMLDQFFARNNGKFVEDVVGELAHEFVVGGFEQRAKRRLTGEWIVYAEDEGRCVYLTIARHDEGDEKIFDRIRRDCEPEFPGLIERVRARP